jgi:hypothetical protein
MAMMIILKKMSGGADDMREDDLPCQVLEMIDEVERLIAPLEDNPWMIPALLVIAGRHIVKTNVPNGLDIACMIIRKAAMTEDFFYP